MYMLGRIGTDEFVNDIVLYNELKLWVETHPKRVSIIASTLTKPARVIHPRED
jgi:hypothetical protein